MLKSHLSGIHSAVHVANRPHSHDVPQHVAGRSCIAPVSIIPNDVVRKDIRAKDSPRKWFHQEQTHPQREQQQRLASFYLIFSALAMTAPSLSKMSTPGINNVYALPSDAVWLITGCSSGLGLSLAQLIAAHPTHRLVATARDPSKLKDALPSNFCVLVVPLDVNSTASVTSALDTVLNHPGFGRIDVLGRSQREAFSSPPLPCHSHHWNVLKRPGSDEVASEQRRLRIDGRHRVLSALLPRGAKLLR